MLRTHANSTEEPDWLESVQQIDCSIDFIVNLGHCVPGLIVQIKKENKLTFDCIWTQNFRSLGRALIHSAADDNVTRMGNYLFRNRKYFLQYHVT